MPTMTKTLGMATAVAVLGLSAVTATSASAAVALPTITTVTSSLNPSTVGDPVTFTATVTKTLGIPLGTVQFLDAGSVLSAPLSLVNGTVQYTTSTLPVGSHDITASFLPVLDPLSQSSLSGVVTQVVNSATGGGVCLPGQTTQTPTISAPARVVGPHAVTVHGSAGANDAVDLYQKVAGSTVTSKVGSTVADASGAYSFSRNVRKQTSFAVQATSACGPAKSATAVTKVALAVTETVASPKKGKLRLRAVTAPRVANQLARFYQVKKGGKRVLLAKVATGPKGIAHKTIHAKSGKRYRVLVKVAAPTGNLAGTSHVHAVRVK